MHTPGLCQTINKRVELTIAEHCASGFWIQDPVSNVKLQVRMQLLAQQISGTVEALNVGWPCMSVLDVLIQRLMDKTACMVFNSAKSQTMCMHFPRTTPPLRSLQGSALPCPNLWSKYKYVEYIWEHIIGYVRLINKACAFWCKALQQL